MLPLSFAFVPAQTFENGVVRITVVEGYVADIKIKGDPGTAEKRIRAIAGRIRADRPLRQETFERYINVLGLTPGVKIAAIVVPPQTTDGATTLEMDVERKPFNIATGIDKNHPGVQGIVTATENGLLGQGETLGVSALLPKGRNDQTYFDINGALPIGTDGFTVKADASHYYGHPGDNPGRLEGLYKTLPMLCRILSGTLRAARPAIMTTWSTYQETFYLKEEA